VALFGFPTCQTPTRKEYLRRKGENCDCPPCKLISQTWADEDGKSLGLVDNAELTSHSAQYICGYVTKKMTAKDDPRLEGRPPEFARMSRKPGIGAKAMEVVGDLFTTEIGCNEIINSGDVPMVLSHGMKKQPLGRYLRRKLREYLGFKETGAQEGWKDRQKEEMRQLLEGLKIDPLYARFVDKKMLLQRENKQKILNLEKRYQIYSGGKKL